MKDDSSWDLFFKLKNDLLNLDPVSWIERNLFLDGKKFQINGNGYKPFADIYRYIGTKALEPVSKPVVLVKSRQTGGTTMCSALEMYFMGSGLFGVNGKPPIRIMHLFPQLELAAAYSKTKLNQMITSSAIINEEEAKKGARPKSYMQSLIEQTGSTGDSLSFKQFVNGNHIWIESTGLDADRIMGRMLSLETELPTPLGFIKLKDLKENDELFDENGNICRVLKLHPIDNSPESYKVIFDDGTEVDACADHLWLTEVNRVPSIRSTKEILNTIKLNHSIKNCKPLNYSEKKLIKDPYIYGLTFRYDCARLPDEYLLSSQEQRLDLLQGLMDNFGTEKNGILEFVHTKKDLINKVNILILSFGIKTKIYKKNNYRIRFSTMLPVFRNKKNNVKKELAKNTYRFIKDVKKISSIPMRCITVDSYSGLFLVTKQCIPTHNTADVMFFDECLPYTQKIITSNGPISIGKLYTNHISNIENPLILSFNEEKQIFEYKKIINVWKNGRKPILKLKIGGKKFKCTPNHRFLTYSGWKKIEDIKIGTRIKSLSDNKISHAILEKKELCDKKVVYDIEIEDNHNFILSFGKMNFKGPIAHNCQKIPAQAIGSALKILTTAKYGKPSKGVQLYFGTPRKKGSDFYKIWMSSTQQYYHLGCASCKKYFPLYTPGSDDWEKIWLHGFIVKCTHCGYEQDKRPAAEIGKWIGLKSEHDEDSRLIGFHINQLYMPMFTKEDILNEKPGIHPTNTERVYKTEVLGEFYQGDSSPITPEEISEMCGEPGRKFAKRLEPNKDEIIVLGIDYGLKADIEQMASPDKTRQGGQSYSTAVVLKASGPGILSIEFATKFKRNDTESKKGLIDEIMRKYSVQLAIGDIGFSQEFSEMMHGAYGDRYIVSRAHNKVNSFVKFNKDSYPKEIVFERDHYIGEMYEQMKGGRIKFPFGDYEKVAWLIEHCASMELQPSISKYGDHSLHYVKGSTPNDGFMALLNAYLAYKFILTNAFTNNNPLTQKQLFQDKKKPLALTGLITRRV